MYLYIRMGASIIVSVFTTRILLQALGASDFGLYNVVAGILSMMGFLSASLSASTQRYISYAEGEGNFSKIKEIVKTSVILHWIMAFLVGVLFIFFGFIFFDGVLNIPEGRETTAMLVYGCLIISTVFSITIVPYEALLNAHENMLYYSILGIIDVFLKLGIAIIVAYSLWDRLLFYGIMMASESFLLREFTKRYCKKHYEESRNLNLRTKPNSEQMRQMTSFAGWNVLNIGTGMISLYGMNVIINHYFGTILNAAMGIANQLAGVMLGVSSNMTKALTPVLVKSEGSKNRDQVLAISLAGCKFSYLLFSFFCIPVFFYMPFLLDLWLENVPGWTVLFSRLMIISCLIDQLFVFLYQTILAQGKVRGYNIVRSIFNIIPIIITIIQYELQWEPFWVLINWIIFKVLFGGLTNLYFAKRNINFPIGHWLIDVMLPCLVITVATGLLCGFSLNLYSETVLLQFLKIVVLFIISVPLYYYLALSSDERRKFKSITKRVK